MKFLDTSSDNEPFRSKQNCQVNISDLLKAIFHRRRTKKVRNYLKFNAQKYGKRKNTLVGDETWWSRREDSDEKRIWNRWEWVSFIGNCFKMINFVENLRNCEFLRDSQNLFSSENFTGRGFSRGFQVLPRLFIVPEAIKVQMLYLPFVT